MNSVSSCQQRHFGHWQQTTGGGGFPPTLPKSPPMLSSNRRQLRVSTWVLNEVFEIVYKVPEPHTEICKQHTNVA